MKIIKVLLRLNEVKVLHNIKRIKIFHFRTDILLFFIDVTDRRTILQQAMKIFSLLYVYKEIAIVLILIASELMYSYKHPRIIVSAFSTYIFCPLTFSHIFFFNNIIFTAGFSFPSTMEHTQCGSRNVLKEIGNREKKKCL